jgi:hypothetical protein
VTGPDNTDGPDWERLFAALEAIEALLDAARAYDDETPS